MDGNDTGEIPDIVIFLGDDQEIASSSRDLLQHTIEKIPIDMSKNGKIEPQTLELAKRLTSEYDAITEVNRKRKHVDDDELKFYKTRMARFADPILISDDDEDENCKDSLKSNDQNFDTVNSFHHLNSIHNTTDIVSAHGNLQTENVKLEKCASQRNLKNNSDAAADAEVEFFTRKMTELDEAFIISDDEDDGGVLFMFESVRSSDNLILSAQSNEIESGVAISPENRVTISPESRVTNSPESSVAISPESRVTNSPESRVAISHENRVAISHESSVAISPENRVAISPENRVVNFQSRASISPQSRASISPESRVTNSPESSVTISLESRASISPETRVAFSPEKRMAISPESRVVIPREGKEAISPESRMSISPESRMVIFPESRVVISLEDREAISSENSAAFSNESDDNVDDDDDDERADVGKVVDIDNNDAENDA